VGVIWGDGIDFEMLQKIVLTCMNWVPDDQHEKGIKGWSAENLVFGMGGGLLQKINRDTQRFAFKSCAQKRNGVWYDVYKKPTDETKASKKGIQKLIKVEGEFRTVREDDPEFFGFRNFLTPVFRNGMLMEDWTFDEVRKNAKEGIFNVELD
jgi:nicotinamide phosphoribosyltransferase